MGVTPSRIRPPGLLWLLGLLAVLAGAARASAAEGGELIGQPARPNGAFELSAIVEFSLRWTPAL